MVSPSGIALDSFWRDDLTLNRQMETEQRRYADDSRRIPEYSPQTPLCDTMISMDMIYEFGYMVEYGKNFTNCCTEGERASHQFQYLQPVEPIVPIKQEEEDWDSTMGNCIQDIFPEWAFICNHDVLHDTETILPEPQEELHDIKPVFEGPYEKLHTTTVETIIPESQIKKEETADVERKSECEKLDDLLLNTEINIKEEITETEINNFINKPTTSKKAYGSFKKNTNIKKVNPCAKKRKTKAENIVIKTKQEEQKENVDIDFISNKTQGKGIEAVDLPSLLEKFEEIEKSETLPNLHNKPIVKDIPTHRAESTKKTQNRPIKQRSCQNNVPKKSLVRTSNQHKVIQDSSQKKLVEMTKILKSKKNLIPIISTIPNIEQFENRNNNTHQMQSDKHTLPSNNVNSGSSIDLEHDYCIVYTDSNPVNKKHISKPHPSKNSVQSGRCNSLKEKSDIVSTKVSDMNKMPTVSALPNKQTHKVNDSLIKINSVLARNILKSRQKKSRPVIEIQTGSKVQQMISVLKKPLNPPSNSKQCISSNNMTESIMTTTSNSSNNDTKNIIQQNTENTPSQNIKQPVRKINIEEYRRKRQQINNSNETNFSVQRKVVYIYHASTMTEPFKEGGKKIWSIREFDTIIKSETETKPKPKCCDVSVQTYKTIFEFSGNSLASNKKDDVAEGTSKSGSSRSRSNTKSRSRSSSSRRSSSSSSSNNSKSRSRSKTRRVSRSRNKNMYKKRKIESNRNRNKSRNRNSSISKSRSSSSSSSISRSKSRSSSRRHLNTYSKLRRSRDSSSSASSCISNARSRRRSRSSSHHSKSSSRYYSRRSRSSSISNRRSRRWSSDRERQYDRDRRYSRRESRQSRDLRRSPSQYYRRPYNDRNDREWQRQVEERRVVYVGGIKTGTTKADLRKRFETFGHIVEISLHFRTKGLSFGFVTFEYKDDAYKAVEHGNDGHLDRYQLSFGGRRAFCQVNYADLDGAESGSYSNNSNSPTNENSFDVLLQQALNRQKLV